MYNMKLPKNTQLINYIKENVPSQVKDLDLKLKMFDRVEEEIKHLREEYDTLLIEQIEGYNLKGIERMAEISLEVLKAYQSLNI
jgi:predicted phage-related endonuclease